MNANINGFGGLIAKAEAAGREAAEACAPQMMCVKNGAGKVYGPFPVCGFAWVVVKPNRGKLADYLKKNAGFSKHWAGGISNYISGYGQSLDMKAAHARAYAEVLREAGYDAYANSRID